jgi:hypothetical protein
MPSCTNHLVDIMLLLLHISIGNWSDVRVKLFQSRCSIPLSVISQRALEFNPPLVVPTATVVPPVVGYWKPLLLRSEIRDTLLDNLIGSIFEWGFKRRASFNRPWSELGTLYVMGLYCGYCLKEDIKGSWDESFWLKLSLKNDIFLIYTHLTYWIVCPDFLDLIWGCCWCGDHLLYTLSI